jgi:hypothetical protein
VRPQSNNEPVDAGSYQRSILETEQNTPSLDPMGASQFSSLGQSPESETRPATQIVPASDIVLTVATAHASVTDSEGHVKVS